MELFWPDLNIRMKVIGTAHNNHISSGAGGLKQRILVLEKFTKNSKKLPTWEYLNILRAFRNFWAFLGSVWSFRKFSKIFGNFQEFFVISVSFWIIFGNFQEFSETFGNFC